MNRTPSRRPSRSHRRTFTALVAQDDGWWIGYVEEIPGVVAQARSHREMMTNLRLALRDILEIRRQDTLAEAPEGCREEAIAV